MSNDKIAKIHLVVREPLRQQILLQLGSKKSLTSIDFENNLKNQNKQEIKKQLDFLEKTRIDGEYLVTKQANASYQLTEKGHYVLEKMITYPQLKTNNYKNLFRDVTKPERKWFTPYLILIVAATIIVGSTLPITLGISLDDAILILILALVAECIFLYVMFLPSLGLNRVTYILMGIPIGFGIWLGFIALPLGIGVLVKENFIFVFGSLNACLGTGPLIGDFIGRLRNYKGPEQYEL